MKDFDCVIPVAGKDVFLLFKSVKYININLNPNYIYIITKGSIINILKYVFRLPGNVILLDEDKIVPNLTFETLRKILVNNGINQKLTGWYLQQFVKMGFSTTKYCKDYYLSWDADTIPLKKIELFNINGKPYFTMKEEYHRPYFVTIKKIFGYEKSSEYSFISENMMFNKKIMNELIITIENVGKSGDSWFKKIIDEMPANENNAFSEFETYGTFVINKMPNSYEMRILNTYRDAGKIITRKIKSDIINKKFYDYDTITLEYRDDPKSFFGMFYKIQKKIIKLIFKCI